MHDLPFIVAAYGVILGGLALYAGLLLRRLAAARRVSLQVRQDAESVAAPPPDRAG